MAVNLIPKDDSELLQEIEEAGARRVFVVGCIYCTGMAYALSEDSDCPTYVELTWKGLKQTALEKELERLTNVLGECGIKVDGSYFPAGFLCFPFSYMMKKYREKARRADTLLTLGCDNARLTIAGEFGGEKRVVSTMRYLGYARGRMRLLGRRLVVERGTVESLGCRECVRKTWEAARRKEQRKTKPDQA